MTESKSKTPFHDHLDVCPQCAHHPFALCHDGAKAMQEEVAIVSASLPNPFAADGSGASPPSDFGPRRTRGRPI